MVKFTFDYWSHFKYCVNDLKLSTADAWYLDLVEIKYLTDAKEVSHDTSTMLNFERELNGASKEWLQHNHL